MKPNWTRLVIPSSTSSLMGAVRPVRVVTSTDPFAPWKTLVPPIIAHGYDGGNCGAFLNVFLAKTSGSKINADPQYNAKQLKPPPPRHKFNVQVCAVIADAPLPELDVHLPSKKNPLSAFGTNFGCALPANCCPCCTPVSFSSPDVAPSGRLTI